VPEHTITTKNAAREQAVRIVKRKELNTWKAVLLRAAAFVLALAAGGIFILMMGSNPLEAYAIIVKGAFVGSVRNPLSSIQATVIIAVPLLIVSLGLAFAFKMKFWNIGAEGQMIAGSIFASYFALRHSGMPHVLLLLTMFAAGAAGGGLWGLIPALFKVRFGTNETLFTLMLNYVAIKIAVFLRLELWKDPAAKGFPHIKAIPDAAHLPKVFGVHAGWIIALVCTAFVFVFLKYTKRGYETRVVGESERTAHYAGINVRKVLVSGVLLSGAIVGLAGFVKLSGASFMLSESIGGGNGFSAVIIAWLAQLNAPVMLLVSLLFAAMEQGAMSMELSLSIPVSVSDIIKGLILFTALASEFFINYRVVFEKVPHAALSFTRHAVALDVPAGSSADDADSYPTPDSTKTDSGKEGET